MTDQQLEQRLRNWYRAEIREAEQAPAALRASVTAIPQRRTTLPLGRPWVFSVRSSMRFAIAAAIGVIAVGSAFYMLAPRPPAAGGPSPTPSASAEATAKATARAASWTATGSMAFQGIGTTILLPNGSVLVVSGTAYGTAADTLAELYDPASGSWTATGPMPIPRSSGTATLLRDGRVLVVPNASTGAELYDPATGSWTRTGRRTTFRGGFFSATLLQDGRVLVAGGVKDNAPAGSAGELASAELYDPATGAWTVTGSMIKARLYQTATLLPTGKVLVAGGAGDDGLGGGCCGPLASAELYDPGTGTWTATGNMTTDRVKHTATLLRDGKVLVTGGNGTSAELYDPTSATWAPTGSRVTTAVIDFTATLLPDGRVLLAGGWNLHLDAQESPIAVASVELYDPATGTWTATASLTIARMQHTATLLPDGRVLVTGGSGLASASAELFDPGSAR